MFCNLEFQFNDLLWGISRGFYHGLGVAFGIGVPVLVVAWFARKKSIAVTAIPQPDGLHGSHPDEPANEYDVPKNIR